MQEIPVMYVGASDGAQRRALLDHIGKLNPISNLFVTPKIAAYTITNEEFGCVFSNSGASGSVTFTLPTPEAGALLVISKIANQTVVISGTIAGGTGGTAITNNTSASYGGVLLMGLDGTSWFPVASQGTWTIS